jgi:hypothetical protein
MGSGEKTTFVFKKIKEWSAGNLKEKLWYEVGESLVTNWSALPVVSYIYVYLYNPSNTTKENTLSCVRLHVSTSGSNYQAFHKKALMMTS